MAGGLLLAAVLDQVLVGALDLDEPPGVALVVVGVDCGKTTGVSARQRRFRTYKHHDCQEC